MQDVDAGRTSTHVISRSSCARAATRIVSSPDPTLCAGIEGWERDYQTDGLGIRLCVTILLKMTQVKTAKKHLPDQSEQCAVMTAVEKRIERNAGFLPDKVPPNYFEDDSDDAEDDFEDLLCALNEVKDLVRKSREQKQSLNEKLKGLSHEIHIESTRSILLTQNVKKLGLKVDELTNVVKNDSSKTMRDQLDNLSREWEIISKSFKVR